MTKLSESAVKRLKALNIKAKSEEEARSLINGSLVDQGIDGMENEDLETLLDMAESFVDETPAEEGEEADYTEASEEDEEEVEEKPVAKKAASKTQVPAKSAPAKKAPAKKVVEEEDEEKPAAKKAVTKPAANTAPEVKKPAAVSTKKVEPAKKVKLNPQKNKDDQKFFDVLKELLPEKNYAYAWIASNGVTIKFKGKNAAKAVVSLEATTKHEDGTITANLYLPTYSKKQDSLDNNDIAYERCWSGVPLLKALSMEEIIETITTLLPEIEESVGKLDKKLGENRTKMEEGLKKGNEKTSKAAPAKTTKKVVEEEEDEEEVEETPVKKAPAKVVAKPAPAPVKGKVAPALKSKK